MSHLFCSFVWLSRSFCGFYRVAIDVYGSLSCAVHESWKNSASGAVPLRSVHEVALRSKLNVLSDHVISVFKLMM